MPAKRFLCRSLWAQIFEKQVPYFSKTPKRKNPGPNLGQDRPEKNSAKCLFEAARFRVLDRHRSTKPTTAPWNLNGARPLEAPTHPLVTAIKPSKWDGGWSFWLFVYSHLFEQTSRIDLPYFWLKMASNPTPVVVVQSCQYLVHYKCTHVAIRLTLHRP